MKKEEKKYSSFKDFAKGEGFRVVNKTAKEELKIKSRNELKKQRVVAKQDQLNDEQVENWRRILSLMFGPYTFIMPKTMVQAMRDKIQNSFENKEVE